MSDNVIMRGNVHIGEGTVVEEYVVLGHLDDGILAVGENSHIRSGSVIYSNVVTGRGLRTGHNVLIRENTEIGENVLIGTNSVIDGNCRIGSNVAVQTNVYITAFTVLEDNVFMGPCSVTTNDKYMRYGDELRGPVVKEGAKIGANSVILPGIVIGEEAVVGSGAVVTKDVAAKATVGGSPAEEIRRRS